MWFLTLALAAEPEIPHTLTISVKSPPAGSTVVATVFDETKELRDPGIGVHSASFVGPAARFAHVELALSTGGLRSPIFDGVIALSDADADVVAFAVSGGTRPSALRTAYAPSALVRMWSSPVTMTRYGWGALLALYAAVLLIAATRRA